MCISFNSHVIQKRPYVLSTLSARKDPFEYWIVEGGREGGQGGREGEREGGEGNGREGGEGEKGSEDARERRTNKRMNT